MKFVGNFSDQPHSIMKSLNNILMHFRKNRQKLSDYRNQTVNHAKRYLLK
jgi:hypothetical protein